MNSSSEESFSIKNNLELDCSSCNIKHDLRNYQFNEFCSSLKIRFQLINKLKLVSQDPYNYLHEEIQIIKTKIDLKNEQEHLSDYMNLIEELDRFQSERKAIIDSNTQSIGSYCAKILNVSINECFLTSHVNASRVNDDINNITIKLKELKEALFDYKNIKLTESPFKLKFVDILVILLSKY